MSFPSDLRHFMASEFQFPELMDVSFLRWLDRVRARAGVPMVITNDARLANTMPTGAVRRSLHKRGRAVDIRSKTWSIEDKWNVMAAILGLADEAPGHVELELVHSETDVHWHIGVDDLATAHELIEADE